MSGVNQVRYWRHPAVSGVDLMRARFTRHEFARHSHDTFAIGVTEVGAEDLGFDDGSDAVVPGGIILINPGEVHTGRGATPGEWGYRVIYPTADFVSTVGGELGMTGPAEFGERIVYDAEVSSAILAAHRAAEIGDRLESSALVETAVGRLLLRYGAGRSTAVAGAGRSDVDNAVAVLRERMTEPPTLGELAAEVGTGKFALTRAFYAAHGLPPFTYLAQLRVRRAQRLLEVGAAPAEVSAAVGFVDQAHLSRHFSRIVGMPPGAYRKAHGWPPQRRTRRGE